MKDEECLNCLRFHSKSCNGVENRGREKITIENSCSGFLEQNRYEELYEIAKILSTGSVDKIEDACSKYNIKFRDEDGKYMCMYNVLQELSEVFSG